jgi:nicotinate-nucleotide adenylyltransferase
VSPAAGSSRVGVFGGSFDPPHVGHLLTAGDAADQLRLDQVLWVPVGTQPCKGAHSAAGAEHRLRMVELTVEGHPRFVTEPSEVRRGGLSFTVDTLEELRERLPAAELFLLIGEDSWRTFVKWREPERIRQLARVAVLTRGGPADPSGSGEPAGGQEEPVGLPTRRVDVSATEIRQRVRSGLPIRGFVVDAVERYIHEHSLYS